MKSKLLPVAVAGALAAPGLALAQSSVTISGFFKVSLENLRIGSPGAARAGLNTTENRMADDFSRILFNVVEDLGGGLQAVGQADLRMPMASGNIVAMSGNTHVGLRSASLGRVIVGRQDVHYLATESDLTALAGDLRADSVSLLAFMANGVAIANASRTPNIIHLHDAELQRLHRARCLLHRPDRQRSWAGHRYKRRRSSVCSGLGRATGRSVLGHSQGQRVHLQPELCSLELANRLQLLEHEARWRPEPGSRCGHGPAGPAFQQAVRLVQDRGLQDRPGVGQVELDGQHGRNCRRA